MFDENKYKVFTFTTIQSDGTKVPTIVAVSTYAGKTVKGYAKLDPRDKYNYEDGKRLAIARCAAKIEAKRVKRSEMKLVEARKQLTAATKHLNDMIIYNEDAKANLLKIDEEVANILKNL